MFQIVGCSTFDKQAVTVTRTTVFRYGDALLTRQILSGNGFRTVHYLLGRTCGDDLTALLAGARTHVQDIIGGHHGLFVVLHDKNGVPQIAQVLQGLDQAGIIALMQADAGLIQYIEHPHQL